MKVPDWISGLDEKIANFLVSLEKRDLPGGYLPCKKGVTKYGRNAGLGFSCFALRIHYTLDLWKAVGDGRQREWENYISSFQSTTDGENNLKRNAYIDPVIIQYLEKNERKRLYTDWLKRWLQSDNRKSAYGGGLRPHEKIIVGETKQAIATLAEVGKTSSRPYGAFPRTEQDVQKYMAQFNWAQPWDAGGQTAALAVFLCLEAPRLMELQSATKLKQSVSSFYKKIADYNTGGYFLGSPTNHGMLVNGAMKVLTALDWLNEPIHFPKKLTDTTLSAYPHSDGCHMVDAVYVLYRCTQQSAYRRSDVNNYLVELLKMIYLHLNSDGGFSFYVGKTGKRYYGVPISVGMHESDIHGTLLIVWALAMIFKILEITQYEWRIIKP